MTFEDLNKFFAIIEVGNDVVVMELLPDKTIKELWPFDAFKKKFIKERVSIETKQADGTKVVKVHQLAERWLKDKRGLQYERLIYAMPGSPEIAGPRDFNGWHGFTVEPIKGDWSRNKEHIFKIICRDNQKLYDWVFNWKAAMIQQPGRHAMSCIVLQGGQGIGKGYYADVQIGGMFSKQQYIHLTGANQLTSDFNEHLSGKVMIYADESTWGGDLKAASRLKALVTEPTVTIHRKFLKMTEEASKFHIVISSNDEWPIPIDLDDRRFCVLNVSPDKRQNAVYFDALYKEFSEGGRAAMLYDLLHHEVDWVALRNPPSTEAKMEIASRSSKPADHWWMDKLHSGLLIAGSEKDWPAVVNKDDLHQDYMLFIETHHRFTRDRRATETELGRFLAKNTDVQAHRTMKAGERTRSFTMPSLGACRTKWIKDHAWPEKYDWSSGVKVATEDEEDAEPLRDYKIDGID